MKLYIFFLSFLLLFSQFSNNIELNDNIFSDIHDFIPNIGDNIFSNSSHIQNHSSEDISSKNNVGQINTNETLNLTSKPLVFDRYISNGEIWSNGTHNKAIVTTQAQNIYDSDNNSYAKYILKKIGSSYYLQSAYGLWRLNKETGVVLLNKNTNQTIYESETWGLIYNGVERTETSKQIKLIEKNEANLTIEVSKSYNQGILNISYLWIQGRLKINVLIKAFVVGNFRVGLKITGLDQFTTTDLINLNKSNFILNFEDMESQINYAHSSFESGVLTLVSNNYALNINDIRELDPTSYETSDDDDFFLNKLLAGTYNLDTASAYLFIGNRTANDRARRGLVRFNLGFIGRHACIESVYLNLTVGTTTDGILNMNMSALGWDITKEPLTESNAQANASVFDDYFLNNGTNYNTTLALTTITADQSNDWNVLTFTQEWIEDRSNGINYIGWQMRQIKDDTDQYCIGFYDAQHGSGQAPTLTISWSACGIPPFISSNQSNSWTNINAFNITAYDQPTGTGSGLNTSSLAYSLDSASWIIVPDSSIVSISDDFPTYFIINNLLAEGSSIISFRISDLNGNWGYSNSSFGKQYYPKFTNSYAFHNETEQLGWGEDWTDNSALWGGAGMTYSYESGIYNNSLVGEVANTNSGSQSMSFSPTLDLSSYSVLKLWAKCNNTDARLSVSFFDSNLNYIRDLNVVEFDDTDYHFYEIELSTLTKSGDFNSSDISIIGIIAYHDPNPSKLVIDGVRLENEDGDSATENVDTNPLGTYSTVAADSSTITENTDSYIGYDSIQYEVNDSNAEWAFQYLYTHTLDISNTDSFSFTLKRNETAYIIARIALYSDNTGANYLKYEPDIGLSTSFTILTFVLADLIEVGSFNSSSLYRIYMIFSKVGGGSVKINFDALNFYKANNTVSFDETDPNIDSIIVSEDLLNPWDHVCYNGSIIYYSNDQTMDSPLNLTVIGSDSLSGFGTFNTSVEWNDGSNVSASGLTTTIIFNYTISESETASNVTITIYDQAGNSDSETVLTELDNISPEAFIIEVELTTLYSSCGYITTTTSDSGAGLLYISVYLDTYRTNVSSGTNEFCNFPVGWSKIYAVAFDNVANSVLANNSGYVNILADYEAKTTTVRDATQDPLSDAMVVLLDWYGGITIALGIIIILFIVRRMIK